MAYRFLYLPWARAPLVSFHCPSRVSFASAPARFQCTSRCQRCCQDAHSKRASSRHHTSHRQRCRQEALSGRAGSLMAHFAWPALLPRSSLQACPLAFGGHPAANAAAGKVSPSVPARFRRALHCLDGLAGLGRGVGEGNSSIGNSMYMYRRACNHSPIASLV